MKITYADLLLDHMRTCRTCIGAKIANTPHYCARGRELIVLTTRERHGT